MIKVGIIGAGEIGNAHASCISKLDEVKIVAIADVNTEKANSLAASLNAKGIVDAKVLDADSLINSKDIDVVYVCVPTSAHAIYVIKAAHRGKHVFVEKPLARTLSEGKEMLISTQKVKFMVGHVLRFFPQYRKVKEILDKGTIGSPGIVRTTRAGGSPGRWFLDIEHGGGVILDFIIHDIDFLRWCFGEPERVYAKGLIFKKIDNIDYALVIIRFKNGVIAHVEGSWAHNVWRTRLEIAGSQGLINLDSDESISLKIEITRPSAGTHEVGPPSEKDIEKISNFTESPYPDIPLLLEDKHFFECIKTGKNPLISGEEGYKSLEISLAALDSIKDDKVVNL